MTAGDGRGTTYHMNRLAGTLIGDVPQHPAQGAAQIWAKNNAVANYLNVELVGVLNNLYAKRNGGTILSYDLQGILNALAGTTGYGEAEAAARIVS